MVSLAQVSEHAETQRLDNLPRALGLPESKTQCGGPMLPDKSSSIPEEQSLAFGLRLGHLFLAM